MTVPNNNPPAAPSTLREAIEQNRRGGGDPWVVVPASAAPYRSPTPDPATGRPVHIISNVDIPLGDPHYDPVVSVILANDILDNPTLWQAFHQELLAAFEDPRATPEEPPRVYRFNIRTLAQLRARAAELAETASLIDGIIHRGSLDILVGDSGLGKSPLLYQAAICVAEGIPFLGRKTTPERVLYLECETGIRLDEKICSALARHVGASADPQNLLLWNMNDCTSAWTLEGLVAEIRPAWVIMDPFKAFFPNFEKESSSAIEVYRQLRRLKQKFGCTITGIHHIRKPGDGEPVAHLDRGSDPKPWFLQARGAREIINGVDCRIGLDIPSNCDPAQRVLRGYGHGGDVIPSQLLETVLDADGEPLGFSPIIGVSMLPPEQQDAFLRLPLLFHFHQAMTVYGKKNQATADFLDKCIGAGLVRKVQRGTYTRLDLMHGKVPEA